MLRWFGKPNLPLPGSGFLANHESGAPGKQQVNSGAALQASLSLKVLFGLPLRQTTGFVESLLELVGLSWAVPDFSTLCRRQKTLAVKFHIVAQEVPCIS